MSVTSWIKMTPLFYYFLSHRRPVFRVDDEFSSPLRVLLVLWLTRWASFVYFRGREALYFRRLAVHGTVHVQHDA
jgi:hypothetical protein